MTLQSFEREIPMSHRVHVTDLLQAAKLLADAQQDVILSYLICMAILEARQTPQENTVKAA